MRRRRCEQRRLRRRASAAEFAARGLVASRAGIAERWGYRTRLARPRCSRARSVAPRGAPSGRVLPAARARPGLPERSDRAARRRVGRRARRGAARCSRHAGWDGRRAARGAGAWRGVRRREAVAAGVVRGAGRRRWPRTACRRCSSAAAADRSSADAELSGVALERDAVADRSGRHDRSADARRRAGAVPRARHERLGRHASGGRRRHAGHRGVRSDRRARRPGRIGDAPRSSLDAHVWCRPCMLRECPLDHGACAASRRRRCWPRRARQPL